MVSYSVLARHLTLGIALAATACSTAQPRSDEPPRAPALASDSTVIPTRDDEHRWLVRPVTTGGDTLEMYTDSGGGFLFIARERLSRDAVLKFEQLAPSGDSVFSTAWPVFQPTRNLPAPRFMSPPRIVTARGGTFAEKGTDIPGRDGFLGNGWLAGRIWVFDYPAHRLVLLSSEEPQAPLGGSTVPLGFRNAAAGGDAPWFARIRVAVDGDSLDLLFDTGATTALTPSAMSDIGDSRPASRATSFISRTLFDQWHAHHPSWRMIANAEMSTHADMIEVPEIAVAGLTAGPVWFTSRPDANFTKYMSQWMDLPIVGALGGSALQYFRVTVDYPNRRATFARSGKSGS